MLFLIIAILSLITLTVAGSAYYFYVYKPSQKVDCSVSDWNIPEDSSCTRKSDGKFYKTKSRTIINSPKEGGSECPSLTEDIPCNKIDCSVSSWTNPEDSSCTRKSDGKFYKTRTRTVTAKPSNGGSECPSLTEELFCSPVDCSVGNWIQETSCDSNGNRRQTRNVITQPKFGGTECPSLVETNYDESCFKKESCGTVVQIMGIYDNTSLQNKIYSQDANKQFWEGYNCNLSDRIVSNIPKDKLCNFADSKLNSSDYRIVDAARRAKVLLKCPGTLLQEGNFIGAGKVSGNFFTITVENTMSPPSHGTDLSLDKNIGKKIRIWYGDDGYPTGWAFSSDWIYPPSFVKNNITLADLGSIDYTSALEIIDKKIGTSYGYKFLLWFGATSADKVPTNNPKEAVKWISINKPSNVGMAFGGDAGTFLGSQYFNAILTYGSGDLNAPAVVSHIKSRENYFNKFDYSSLINSMRIKI